MFQFNRVQINSIYFTSDDLSSGYRYLGNVEGLTPLRLTNNRVVRRAIDGTPRRQARGRLGREVRIRFDLVPDTKYEALITSLNSTEGSGNDHAVVITGDKGTFTLTCVLVDLNDSGQVLAAGHKDVEIVFWVKAVTSIV